MRTNFSKKNPTAQGFAHYAYIRALEAVGYGPIGVSASGIQTFNFNDHPMAGTIVPSLITKGMVTSFYSQINRIGYEKGLIFTSETPDIDVIKHGTDIGITIIPASILDDKLNEKEAEIEDIHQDFQKSNQNVSLYEKRKLFSILVNDVEKAKTNNEKKKSLEKLAYIFIESLGLIPESNPRTSSAEIDIFVTNTKKGPFWTELGTPILVECKNTKDPSGAADLREFRAKMGNLKTGFFISWRGISGSDEYRDGKKVVHDAWVQGKRIIVLQDFNFKEIANGSLPEEVLIKLHAGHWKQYEG